MNGALGHILAVIEEAFRTAPVWSDSSVTARPHYKQVGGRPVAQRPRTELPPDPFSGFSVLPQDPISDMARKRYYEPLGHSLALHAKTQGAATPDALSLTVEIVDANGEPAVKATVSVVEKDRK